MKGNNIMPCEAKYFRFIGCFTWVAEVITIIAMIVNLVFEFINHVGFWPIFASFVIILFVYVIGSGLGFLFHGYATKIEDDYFYGGCHQRD